MAHTYLIQLSALLKSATSGRFRDVTLECKHFFSGAAVYADGRICMSLTTVGFAIKLPEESRNILLKEQGAKPLRYFPKAPIKKDYVILPKTAFKDRTILRHWVKVSIEYTLSLPAPIRKGRSYRVGERMESQDMIVAIPKTMEKYFGCSGKMLKPSPNTVASLIKKIPKGQVTTLDAICKTLAKKFKTEVTCPATTEKSLCLAATESVTKNTPLPYWRVLKKNGELIRKLPNGIEGHAASLMKEGHKIFSTSKSKCVEEFERVLHQF